MSVTNQTDETKHSLGSSLIGLRLVGRGGDEKQENTIIMGVMNTPVLFYEVAILLSGYHARRAVFCSFFFFSSILP